MGYDMAPVSVLFPYFFFTILFTVVGGETFFTVVVGATVVVVVVVVVVAGATVVVVAGAGHDTFFTAFGCFRSSSMIPSLVAGVCRSGKYLN